MRFYSMFFHRFRRFSVVVEELKVHNSFWHSHAGFALLFIVRENCWKLNDEMKNDWNMIFFSGEHKNVFKKTFHHKFMNERDEKFLLRVVFLVSRKIKSNFNHFDVFASSFYSNEWASYANTEIFLCISILKNQLIISILLFLFMMMMKKELWFLCSYERSL